MLMVVGMAMVDMLLRRRGTEDLSLCLHLLHLLHLFLAGPHSANRLHVGNGDLALSLEPFTFHEVVLGLLLEGNLAFAHAKLALALLLHLDLQLLPLALLVPCTRPPTFFSLRLLRPFAVSVFAFPCLRARSGLAAA